MLTQTKFIQPLSELIRKRLQLQDVIELLSLGSIATLDYLYTSSASTEPDMYKALSIYDVPKHILVTQAELEDFNIYYNQSDKMESFDFIKLPFENSTPEFLFFNYLKGRLKDLILASVPETPNSKINWYVPERLVPEVFRKGSWTLTSENVNRVFVTESRHLLDIMRNVYHLINYTKEVLHLEPDLFKFLLELEVNSVSADYPDVLGVQKFKSEYNKHLNKPWYSLKGIKPCVETTDDYIRYLRFTSNSPVRNHNLFGFYLRFLNRYSKDITYELSKIPGSVTIRES